MIIVIVVYDFVIVCEVCFVVIVMYFGCVVEEGVVRLFFVDFVYFYSQVFLFVVFLFDLWFEVMCFCIFL